VALNETRTLLSVVVVAKSNANLTRGFDKGEGEGVGEGVEEGSRTVTPSGSFVPEAEGVPVLLALGRLVPDSLG